MNKAGTAPALGGVTKKYKKEWLYNFTRNSIKMIKEKDSIAVQLFEENNRLLMPSYHNLTNSDFDAIYHFVEKRYKMSLGGIPVHR